MTRHPFSSCTHFTRSLILFFLRVLSFLWPGIKAGRVGTGRLSALFAEKQHAAQLHDVENSKYLFNKFDLDADGTLSLEEFHAGLSVVALHTSALEDQSSVEDALDTGIGGRSDVRTEGTGDVAQEKHNATALMHAHDNMCPADWSSHSCFCGKDPSCAALYASPWVDAWGQGSATNCMQKGGTWCKAKSWQCQTVTSCTCAHSQGKPNFYDGKQWKFIDDHTWNSKTCTPQTASGSNWKGPVVGTQVWSQRV